MNRITSGIKRYFGSPSQSQPAEATPASFQDHYLQLEQLVKDANRTTSGAAEKAMEAFCVFTRLGTQAAEFASNIPFIADFTPPVKGLFVLCSIFAVRPSTCTRYNCRYKG